MAAKNQKSAPKTILDSCRDQLKEILKAADDLDTTLIGLQAAKPGQQLHAAAEAKVLVGLKQTDNKLRRLSTFISRQQVKQLCEPRDADETN